nr:hypothetical protein [Tanacetum cinerariifolium]
NLKELFTLFDQCLIDEVTEVQHTCKQMELAVEQHCAEKTKFQTKLESVLQENDRLLTQALSVKIMNIVVHDCMNRDTVSSPESAPTFAELFEINDLKAQVQEKDTVILKLKEKINSFSGDDKEIKATREVEEIETHNLELDHKELPKVSMVNSCLKKLKFHMASFDMVVKERTTATAITEGTSGFEHTKAYFRNDIIPFVKNLKELFTLFDQCLIDEVTERDTMSFSESAPTFVELFEINELKAQIQEKDTVILKLKEKLNSFSGDVKERKVEREVEEIETQNLELDHKEKVLVIIALKEQLKGKAVLTEAVSLNPIDPALLQADIAPLVPKLRKNRTAHIDYIRHTQEEAATLREIVESERLLSPLNTSLAYACKYTRQIQELLMILQQTCPSITDL